MYLLIQLLFLSMLPVYLSAYSPGCLFTNLLVYLFIRLPVYVSIYSPAYLYVCLPADLSVSLLVYYSICLHVLFSIFHLSTCSPVILSTCLSTIAAKLFTFLLLLFSTFSPFNLLTGSLLILFEYESIMMMCKDNF